MADVTQLPADPSNVTTGLAVPSSASPKTTILGNEQSIGAITINPGDGSSEFSVPASAYSLQGFREWALSEEYPERGQITFSSDGLIIDMSPELFETHNYIKMDVGSTLNRLVQQRKLGRFFGDRALFSNERGSICTEPDAMFISGQSVHSGRCTLVESKRPGVNIEVLGSPDWILEVVSPTSVRKDKVILREGYFRAGVGEYWIIDSLGDEIEFQMLVPGMHGYDPVESRDGWLASPTFGCSFRLSAEKDKDGFLHYTLHVQERS